MLFWMSAGAIVYTLAGYPVLMRGLCAIRAREHRRERISPRVTLVVAVHNAEGLIRQKIENTLELTYPRDKLDIAIASEGSTDGTNEIVEGYGHCGIRLIEIPEHRGKHYAQISALTQANSEIVVFTDAAIILPPDAIEQIVSNFADPQVGCVSSEDRIVTNAAANAEAAYVPAEMQLRRLEAAANSVVGVSGSFFAARREICENWHCDQTTDFFIVLHAVAKGYRAIVDPQSVGYFTVAPSSKTEFPRKVRTVVHGLQVVAHHLHLLDPSRFGIFAWQLFSHKLLRWLLPFALLALFVSNALLWSRGLFFQLVFVAQSAGYVTGLVGWFVRPLAKIRPIQLATFFLVSNAAVVVAWLRFATGEKFVTWEPTRR